MTGILVNEELISFSEDSDDYEVIIGELGLDLDADIQKAKEYIDFIDLMIDVTVRVKKFDKSKV